MHAGDDDDVRRHCRSKELALGNKPALVHKLVLELDSTQVLVLELGNILVQVLVHSMLGQVLVHSTSVLAHSSRCHDDDEDQLLLWERKTPLRPLQPKLESRTSWSNLLIRRDHLLGEPDNIRLLSWA